MKTKTLFSNNLPFSNPVNTSLEEQTTRIKNNKASMIIIDGGVGEGKTTLAVHCADYINKINKQPPIALDGPQYAMGGEDFIKKIVECHNKKFPVIIYDESGDFSKRTSITKFNNMLNRTFETFRAFKIIVILSLPTFNTLDNSLLEKNIPRLLIHCYNRNNKYGHFKAYSLWRMYWIKQIMSKQVVKSDAYDIESPNYYGQFYNLPPERAKELDKISIKNKIEISKQSYLDMSGLVTYSQIAKKLNYSIANIRVLIKKHKILPKTKIGRVVYFTEDTIDQLADVSN